MSYVVVVEGRGRGTVKNGEKKNLENQDTDSKEDYRNVKQGILKQILKVFKCQKMLKTMLAVVGK